MPILHARPLRRLLVLAATFVAAASLVSTVSTATAQSVPPPHWGNFKWNGGGQSLDLRAFWLFDRTGNPTAHVTIKYVVDAWNAARDDNPELPFIGIVQDDANAGRCFVNNTPGWSVASACMMPKDIHGVKAIAARNPDSAGHLLGAAFAISEGLDGAEQLAVVCHAFGHVMGLDDSDNSGSCMFPTSAANQVKWYDADDTDAILDLYAHDETPTTTTTAAPTTSTTAAPTTTTTTTVPATTTTVASTTTTTLPPIGQLCGFLPLPIACE
jgi:Matrixin